MLLILLFIPFNLWATNDLSPSRVAPHQLIQENEPIYFIPEEPPPPTFKRQNEMKYPIPRRSFSLIVGRDGIYPKELIAFEGEWITLYVTGATPSLGCAKLEDSDVFLAANLGRISEGEFHLKKPGIYRIYCPGYDYQAHLKVLPRVVKKNRTTLP